MSEDIVISYRRDGADAIAWSVKERLEKIGYTVFLDNDSLGRGKYMDNIANAILNCTDFLLLLPENALDRCREKEDIFRKEIECAIKSNKNIIPLMLTGFDFPKELPESIQSISEYNGVKLEMAHFKGDMQKLQGMLLSEPNRNAASDMGYPPRGFKQDMLGRKPMHGNKLKRKKKKKWSYVLREVVITLVILGVIALMKTAALSLLNFSIEGPGSNVSGSGSFGGTELAPDEGIQVGDIYDFGSYEQDNDVLNGTEKVEWIVLDKDDTGVLLISKYGIECQMYNDVKCPVTWEDCNLRQWLNEDFYNCAFTESEKSMIRLTQVRNQSNPEYDTNGGYDTMDRIFLLSLSEAETYLNAEALKSVRLCTPTLKAKEQGAWYNEYTDYSCWWLRSSGYASDMAARINDDGQVDSKGNRVNNAGIVVRPVVWVEVE